jgi:hypothetical protein
VIINKASNKQDSGTAVIERKNKHTNKQEEQTFAAHYELWFSRGGRLRLKCVGIR